MNVAFVFDSGNADGNLGGAELTMREFADAAPEPLVESLDEADTVVIGNCVGFGMELAKALIGKRVVWYHNDLSPHINSDLKGWLDHHATHMFCSPLQRDRYGRDGHLIPPAIDLNRFRSADGVREGVVSVGSWQNPMKGQQSLLEWAVEHGPVDVYGTGPFIPRTPPLEYKGPLEPEGVPEVLAAYQTFVHLPWAVEPFGRCVVEAWASGCELVVNRLVGATYWIREAPSALESAAEDFWKMVAS